MSYGKRTLAIALSLVIAVIASFTADTATTSTFDDVQDAIESAFLYKYNALSAQSTDEFLEALSENAGSYSVDWYYIALSRYGVSCDNSESVTALKNKVKSFYADDLSTVKATDMQRVALALLSCSQDIKSVEGNNLLADCTYNRASYKALEDQGINALAYALIVLDSKNYSVSSNAVQTRQDIIDKILDLELENGGFALTGTSPDVDTTAIVLQSLAPYMSQSKVKSAVNRSINKLSSAQCDSGAFKSMGKENAESTAQVLIALTSLDIDPFEDSRFIKDGNTAFDGLMSFAMSNGGFCHITGYAADNMATYQSLCALISCYRFLNGESRFYDFTSSKNSKSNTIINNKKSSNNTNSNSKSSEKSHSHKKSTSSSKASKNSSGSNSKTSKKSSTSNNNNNNSKSEVESTQSSTADESSLTESTQNVVSNCKSDSTSDGHSNTQIAFVPFAVLVMGYIVLFIIKSRVKNE